MKSIKLLALASVFTLGAQMHAATQQELNSQLLQCKDAAQAKALLKEGANVDARDENGNTLLILAAGKTNYKLVEFLLANGAYVEKITTKYWENLFEMKPSALKAAVEGHITAMTNMDIQGEYDETEAKANAQHFDDYIKTVDALLKHGANATGYSDAHILYSLGVGSTIGALFIFMPKIICTAMKEASKKKENPTIRFNLIGDALQELMKEDK